MANKLTITEQKQINQITGSIAFRGYCVCLEVDGTPSIWKWAATIEDADSIGREWTTQEPVYLTSTWNY